METAKAPFVMKGDYYIKQREFEKEIRTQLTKAGLHTLQDIRSSFCVLDLSGSYWYDLGCLLWLVSLLHVLRKQGNEIQLVFPEPTDAKAVNLWGFLIRWRFFDTLFECVDDPINLLKPQQVPYMHGSTKYVLPTERDQSGQDTFFHRLRVLEITTVRADKVEGVSSDDQLEAFLTRFHDKIIVGALSSLCGWDENVVTAFRQRVVREGIRNSILHARGSFATIAMRLDQKNLTLAIADNGIGIPQNLRIAFRETGLRKDLVNRSDAELIKFFTEPEMVLDSKLIRLSVERGVSSRPGHAGEGLYYLKSLVLGQGGELRIRSGNACVDFTQAKDKVEDGMLLSPGTVIRIQTPLKTP